MDYPYGITPEERQLQNIQSLKKLGVPVKEFNKKQLEQEIIAFLKRKQCLTLATTGSDGYPRTSILDYQSDGLTLYMVSEGGENFRNIEHTDEVAISIGFSDGTAPSEYGLTMQGRVKVYKAPSPNYMKALLKLRPFLEEWGKALLPMENVLKRTIMARAIKFTPEKMTYMNLPDGVPLMLWEK